MTKAALKHGLSLEDLELLDPTGSDEEFESRAAALAERLSKAAEPGYLQQDHQRHRCRRAHPARALRRDHQGGP